MFFIPGWLISLVTFPGVVLHEWAHAFFCRQLGVTVHEVKYFQIGKGVAGYVKHEVPKKYSQTFWISIGPLLVNSITAILLSYIATFAPTESLVWYILLWLGLSIGMHSFPSDQDMSHISLSSKAAIKEGGTYLHYLAFPFVWLVWIANKLRVIWFDLIWAILLISLGGGFGTFKDITTSKNSVLHSQIETCKAEVKTVDDNLYRDEAKLKAMDIQVKEYIKNKDKDNYDKLVKPFNTLLDQYNAEQIDYESKLKACNALIDQYNQI